MAGEAPSRSLHGCQGKLRLLHLSSLHAVIASNTQRNRPLVYSRGPLSFIGICEALSLVNCADRTNRISIGTALATHGKLIRREVHVKRIIIVVRARGRPI